MLPKRLHHRALEGGSDKPIDGEGSRLGNALVAELDGAGGGAFPRGDALEVGGQQAVGEVKGIGAIRAVGPEPALDPSLAGPGVWPVKVRGEMLVKIRGVEIHGHGHLTGLGEAPGRVSHGLGLGDGRQEQCHKDAQDEDGDRHFQRRETSPPMGHGHPHAK